ncbi:MAG: transglutaminase family protein [Pseudomonadota bacterium]
MQLSIQHRTQYSYEPEATSAALRMKLFPPDTASQRAADWRVTVNGDAVTPMFTDANGNPVALWHKHQPVEEIEVLASGTVTTSDTAGVLKDIAQAARPGVFLRETPLTKGDDEIRGLTSEVEGDSILDRMHALSALVSGTITYRKGATAATTTATEALARGAGVCQDQAHVFVSAARLMGVPARYVAGYVFDPDGSPATEETHAWAEAYIDDLGWTGFDITHQVCPTDLYVRLSSGLDAADAAPIRGTLSGEPEETLSTIVSVSQSQSQQ